VVLGSGGIEKIIQLSLTDSEKAAFQKSVDAVKSLVASMESLLKA
jgi:malate dehydrogenase